MEMYDDERALELRPRGGRHHEEHDDDEFSMSSYDGEQGDSLVIKPPQAVVQRRVKKRDRRERHKHKSERHKERHKSKEHRSNHEERRREHRRHREQDQEYREARRHEKHRERKSERPVGDLRNKLEDRKLVERKQERRKKREQQHMREREEYHMDDREQYEARHMNTRGGGSHSQMLHHRERRHDDRFLLAQTNVAGLQLSPREKAERDKRMERILQADKQKAISQQYVADVRRQRREEERREERRMEEYRQRAEASMLRHVSKSISPTEDLKRRKTHLIEETETVELSDDDEKPSPLVQRGDEYDDDDERLDDEELPEEEEEELEESDKRRTRKGRDDDDEVDEEDMDHQTNESSSRSEVSEASESSSNSTEEEEEDEEEEEVEGEDDDDEDEEVLEAAPTGRGEREKDVKIESPVQSSPKYSGRSASVSNTESSSDEDSTDEGEKSSEGEEEKMKNGKPPVGTTTPPPPPIEVKENLPPYYPAIMGCRSVDEFECLNRIEEGTYGVVYRAREKTSNEIVALKRLKMEKEKEGFPITSLREVNTLLKGQHVNIVTVREIVVGSNMDKIYIVMDYVEHDLKSLMETMKQKKHAFTIGEAKTLMLQLLRAVHHLHDNWILHRDLKTSNLLLSHRGILKVGDFGLAREYGSPLKQYTPIVVTLWYRAPELLLGTKEYSCPIDVWSVGCIFGELLGMQPMFPGKSEIDQLNKIFKDLGTPSEKIWPGYSQLSVVKKTQFAEYPYNHLRERFKSRLSDEGFNLLNRFLTYNPSKRITCFEGMDHPYFHKEAPAPIDPAMFPTWPAKSENPHGRAKKTGNSPKPPSGGKVFKELVEGEDDSIAGFFLGGAPSAGPGFTLKF